MLYPYCMYKKISNLQKVAYFSKKYYSLKSFKIPSSCNNFIESENPHKYDKSAHRLSLVSRHAIRSLISMRSAFGKLRASYLFRSSCVSEQSCWYTSSPINSLSLLLSITCPIFSWISSWMILSICSPFWYVMPHNQYRQIFVNMQAFYFAW